jgi:gamma-glutamyltranspeptidase/glutathione hydrolase
MTAKGAVACGHPATAGAAEEILTEGGNAFDAALAAFAAATVAEPVLSSLGGGGFLLAHSAGGDPLLYDFFVETPLQRRPGEEIDFYPILADFGTATQEFHIGLGAIATPGAVGGLFAIHQDLASLPMARILAPAVRLARRGVTLRPVDTYLFEVVGPILTASPEAEALYTGPDGKLLREGGVIKQPALADTLEALAAEGEALFYQGELARRLVELCRAGGGLMTMADLADYRVARRRPLQHRYRGARILTNPPPSAGGVLIAFALALMECQDPASLTPAELSAAICRVMGLTNQARVEARLHEAIGESEEEAAADRLFDPALLARYRREVLGRPAAPRGTTHISVVDSQGNMASLSLSNGEGCGRLLPGSGIMINNMLGEEDLNPAGFHNWPAGSRMSSMMSPTLAFGGRGSIAALGSGGSNRIRSAILQVLIRLIDFSESIEAAVAAPRLHFESGTANLEAGLPRDAKLTALAETVIDWPPLNLFFGGVHAVTRAADGSLAAAGDPRRGGAARVVP